MVNKVAMHVRFHLDLCRCPLLTIILPPILIIITPFRHVTAMLWHLTATSLVFQLSGLNFWHETWLAPQWGNLYMFQNKIYIIAGQSVKYSFHIWQEKINIYCRVQITEKFKVENIYHINYEKATLQQCPPTIQSYLQWQMAALLWMNWSSYWFGNPGSQRHALIQHPNLHILPHDLCWFQFEQFQTDDAKFLGADSPNRGK
jgi:hypothetical protein